MRILQVHGRYRSAAPSGENAVVDQEAAALRAAGQTVGTFERHSDEIADWSVSRRATLPAQVLWNRQSHRDLTRRLLEFRPDVVHVHNTFPLISASALYACRAAGVPVVATLHNYKLLCASGDFFRDGSPCHDCADGTGAAALRHGCYRGSRVATVPVAASIAVHRSSWRHLVAAYIFISAAHRDLMQQLELPGHRVFVKHNFVRTSLVPQQDRRHEVVYLGRLDAAKGVPFLQRAWDDFRSRHPASALRLVVAGGGPLEKQLSQWAAGHDSVDLLGLLDRDGAARALQGARAAVVPSQWEETFGLVAVEAMAAGVAPVAPARGSFPELVDHDVDGVLFDPGDASALARVLADIDRRPDHFAELGRRGRRTYEQRFRVERNVEQLLGVYRFAMDNPVGGRRVPA